MTPLERADELLSLASADAEALVSHRIIQARQLVQYEQSERVACDGGQFDARYPDGGRQQDLDGHISGAVPEELEQSVTELVEAGEYPSKSAAMRDLLGLGLLVHQCDAGDLLEGYANMEATDE